MGDGGAAGCDEGEIVVGEVDAVGEHRAGAEQARVAQHLDRRAAVALANGCQLGRGLAGVDVDARAVLGCQRTDRRQLLLVEQVRAVRADPPPPGRRGGQQVAGPRDALVETPAVGAGELDEHRAGAQVEAGSRGHGRRRLREEVHVERGGDPGAEALGDGERGACRDGLLGEHVALGREESSEEAVEIDVVGETAEHRHRQVGVSVDEPGQDDAAACVDDAVGDRACRARFDRGDRGAVDEDAGPVVDGPGGVHRDDGGVDDRQVGHVGQPFEDRPQQRADAGGRFLGGRDHVGAGERNRADPGRQVRRQGDAEHLHAGVAGGDRLEHGGHADEVGADRRRHADLGGCLEVRPRQPEVDAFRQVGIDRAGEVAQAWGVDVGQVDVTLAERWLRPGQRRQRGEVDVVADQHRVAHRPLRTHEPGGVGEDHRAAAGGGGDADGVGDHGGVVALVQVEAAEEHEDAVRRQLDRADRADVATRRRRREAGEVVERHGRSVADGVGGASPSGPEHDGDVVASDARRPGERRR